MVNDLRLLETEVKSDSIKHRETSPSIVKDSNFERNPVGTDLLVLLLLPVTMFLNL